MSLGRALLPPHCKLWAALQRLAGTSVIFSFISSVSNVLHGASLSLQFLALTQMFSESYFFTNLNPCS